MENQHKDMIGLQPTEPDLLYQKPTNYARRKPMEQTKQEQFIIRRISAHRRHHLQGQGRIQRDSSGDYGGKDSADDPK